MECPKCGAIENDPLVCSVCGVIFEKYEASKSVKLKQEHQQQLEALTNDEPSTAFEFGFPVFALAFAFVVVKLMPFLAWALSMWVHEFGHAFAGWFGGIAATPFIGWTSLEAHRSWRATICFPILLGLLGYKSWEKKSYFLVTTFICMFIANIYFRFVMSEFDLPWVIAYMGIGGEFWISAWLMIAYHYRWPENTYWKLLRFPVLMYASITFWNVFQMWLDVSSGKRDIPWGSLWSGDNQGDMNFLRDEWLWMPKLITSGYLRLGYICLAAVVANFIFQMIRKGVRQRPTPKLSKN